MEFALWPYDDFDYELDYIILVEGAMDKLRLESLGYKNVFCLFGNKITEHQTELLIEIEKELIKRSKKKLKVFVFPDADAGGDILISFANQRIKYLFDSYVIELPWDEENPLDPGSATERQIRIAINKSEKLYKVVNKKNIN
jgi:5S rRNA maturation endonuclease (ribonuclease M5)